MWYAKESTMLSQQQHMAIACSSKHTSMVRLFFHCHGCCCCCIRTRIREKKEKQEHSLECVCVCFLSIAMLIVLMNIGVKCHSLIPTFSFAYNSLLLARALFFWNSLYTLSSYATRSFDSHSLFLVELRSQEYVILHIFREKKRNPNTHTYSFAHINLTLMRSFSVYITITCWIYAHKESNNCTHFSYNFMQ